MGWDGPSLVNLGDVLANLYPERDASRRVVDGAGVPHPAKISFDAAADVNWFNILTYANKQDVVLDVVAFALGEYPKSQSLLLARERGALSAVRGPDIRKAVAWAGPGGETLERMVSGEDSLVDVSFLEVGVKRSEAVARVELSKGTGTGFLVEGGLLVTNHHVLPDAAAAAKAEVQFNYQMTADGLAAVPVSYRLAPERHFQTSPAEGGDDWTAVAVAGEPEKRFAPLALAEVEVEAGNRVNIIQHPMGLPKQMSFFHNTVAFVGNGRVQYLTDTQPGSSGSPVFDKRWRVVALHHSGGLLREPGVKNGRASYRNEGIHIGAVIRGMKAG